MPLMEILKRLQKRAHNSCAVGTASQPCRYFSGYLLQSPLKFKGTSQGNLKQLNTGEGAPNTQVLLWLCKEQNSGCEGTQRPFKLLLPTPPTNHIIFLIHHNLLYSHRHIPLYSHPVLRTQSISAEQIYTSKI